MKPEKCYIHRQCHKCDTVYSHEDGKQPKWNCAQCSKNNEEPDPWYSYCYSKDKELKFKEDRQWSSPVRDSYWVTIDSPTIWISKND